MTKGEVLVMEAGEELDEAVERHIFDWEPKLTKCGDVTEYYRSDYPPYSTSIAAAWRVLEKLKGYEFRMHNEYHSSESGMECYWYCGIEEPEYLGERYFSATEKILATAICKAALLAKVEK